MQELNLLEVYKTEIEIFLATMGIFKSYKIINSNSKDNAETKEFIKKQMQKMFSGNLDGDVLNEAIDDLLPYLYEK